MLSLFKKFFFLYVFTIGISCGTKVDKSYIEIRGEAQGTTFFINYYDSLQRDFTSDFVNILNDFDDELSTYKNNSLINRFNEENELINLDSTTYFNYCFEKSSYWKFKMNGFFDPAIKHIIDYGKQYSDSMSSDILDLDRTIGSQNNILTKKDTIVKLDFNAIAQGYSVDVLSDFLEQNGIHNYMVEIGGEIRVAGKNKNENNWLIAIESPKSLVSDRKYEQILSLTDVSIATSGSYRKYKELDGVKYSHAINPFTGKGVTHQLLSVTVITSKCIDADALATAFLVMGEEKSKKWLNKNADLNIAVYFIISVDDGFREHHTANFSQYLSA